MQSVIVDTSCLYAMVDRDDDFHQRCVDVLIRDDLAFVVSPYVVAELDYLVATRMGLDTEVKTLLQLSSGRFTLAPMTASDMRVAVSIITNYPKLQIGLADASLVVLAKHHDTKSILTLDRRHFDVVRPLQGGRFTLLPARR